MRRNTGSKAQAEAVDNGAWVDRGGCIGSVSKWECAEGSSAAHVLRSPSSGPLSPKGPLLVAGLLSGLLTVQVQAADRYWDPNQTSAGWGGSGIWNLTDFFWSPNGDGVSGPYNAGWDNGAGDNAIFGSTAGTVTLGAGISVHNLTFQSSGWALTGNTLTLTGAAPTINVTNNNHSATISSIIAGTAGLTLTGNGNLYLNNTANTFSGGIVHNGSGTLIVQSDGSLGAASNVLTLNGGSFSSSAVLGANRSVVLGGDVTLGGEAGSALLSGTGSVSVSTGGRMSNNASTYVGDTTFQNYAYQGHTYFTSVRNTGEASSVGSSGDIIIRASAQYTDTVHYTGTGNTSDRTFRLNSINHTAVLSNDGTGTLSLTGSIILEGGTVAINATAADIELIGPISSLAGGGLSLGGGSARTITLGAASTYAGATAVGTFVRASTLGNIGASSSFGTGSTDSQIHITNGTLVYTGSGNSSDRTWHFHPSLVM